MAYFKIGTTDISNYVSALKVGTNNNYTAQTNANGDTRIDYINQKKVIEVDIIPLDTNTMQTILNLINVVTTISYLEPTTKTMVTKQCLVSSTELDYYTIQSSKKSFKQTKFTFTEL